VTFSPTAAGPVTGSLTFTDSALTSPQTVSLSGGQSGGGNKTVGAVGDAQAR
jgi:hypothetical protein